MTDPADERSGDALELLGVARYLERDYPGAAAAFERAYAAYRRERRQLDAGRAARAAGWVTGGVLGEWAVQNGWFARALSILEDAGDDGAEHGWVLIIRSWSEPDPVAREALLREAVAVGRRVHDPDVEFEALGYLGALLVMTERVERGLLLLDEAMAAACAGEFTDFSSVDSMFCGFFWACELVNDVPRADQWMRTAGALMQERHAVAAFCRAHYGGILTAAGRWEEAEAELVAAVRHFDEGASQRRAAAIIRLADLRVRQGRLEDAARLLDGLDDHPDAVRTLAGLHLARGKPALARDLLERSLPTSDDSVPMAGEFMMNGPLLAVLCEACLLDGDLAEGRRAAQRLRRIADAQHSSYLLAAAALSEGRIASAEGSPSARALLQGALAGFTRAELPMETAVARLELARATASTAPEAAAAEAGAALEAFQRLSASRHADAAAALLRSLGRPSRAGPRGVGSLTRRESEVLGLLGEGLSNPEIAERLFITRKTVEHHVGNLLAKLGLRNRAEAAAYAAREKLGG